MSVKSSAMQTAGLADAVQYLKARIDGLMAVYLFGSRATGEAGADSDFDIAVLADHALNARQRFDLAEGLGSVLGRDVDLIDLRGASTVLRSQVIARGAPLHVVEGAELEAFLDFVFSDYARLNEERGAILRDVGSRGSVYG